MIKISKLKKSFRKTQVLKPLSVEIKKGERIALVGSNGAGKTTLIRCLLGEYVYDGDIFIYGKEPRVNRNFILQKIGFVPQLPPPLKMPVTSLIEFSAKISNTKIKNITKISHSLGLDVEKIKKQPFFKLSGGQKQKLLISIALGRDCDILILDEPAANLDPQARAVLLSLLAKKEQDTVMLISSHRLDEIAPLVNRVLELDRGEVVLDDQVADEINLSSKLSCKLVFDKKSTSIMDSMKQWKLKIQKDSFTYIGEISGADRLKFFNLISRYASRLKTIEITEK
jgi:ABC-2 type transport system ATP-binding protein